MSKQQDFISKIAPLAKADMAKTGVLASLTIAQAILESGWGESGLTQASNNLFGMKGSYNGQFENYETFEYYSGVKTKITDKFKKYTNWSESISDHSSLFLNKERYHNLIGEKDYKVACEKVQADGYATAPTYANELIKIIEQYRLYEYDGGATVQKLAMPINQSRITCGYKDEAPNYYTLGAGQVHYGMDMVGTPQGFYASGDGIVVGTGGISTKDAGLWIAIRYNGVEGYGDLIVRYYHLDQIYVKKCDYVNLDTKIARYGNTGFSTGAHLHVEVDTDVNYPLHTPSLGGAVGGLFAGYKGAKDTTVNPFDVFKLKKSAPESQTAVFSSDTGFVKNRNITIW